jgi:MoxR-like ATPase
MNTQTNDQVTIAQTALLCKQIVDEVEKAVVGKRSVLMHLMAAFLAPGGHILLEDYPGMAKTLIANSFATALGMQFKRIQFTPDLLPGDITGGYIYDNNEGKFQLRKGPIFTNVLLADEINRASPKTQSALLEAMQEYHVTLEGDTFSLADPFIVIATQNPIEYEGTFPLPEAQLDRFIIRLSIGYPRPEEEDEILRRREVRKQDSIMIQPVVTAEIFLAMRRAVEEVHLDPDIRRYMADLVNSTRTHPQVRIGASPRASLALLKLSRTWAAIQGRSFVLPDDVKEFTQMVLGHRIILDPSLWGNRKNEVSTIDEVIHRVPVPVLKSNHDQ